jgi:glycogen debranching enzyme
MNGTVVPDTLLFGGGTMLRGGADGTISPNEKGSLAGLFIGDTRLLAHLNVSVAGRDMLLASTMETNSTRRLTFVPATPRNETSDLVLTVTQAVSSAGLDEELRVHNSSHRPLGVTIEMSFGTDFADQFALRSDHRTFDRSGASTTVTPESNGVTVTYTRDRGGRSFSTGLVIRTVPSAPVSLADDGVAGVLRWALDVQPGQSSAVVVTFHSVADAGTVTPLDRTAGAGTSELAVTSLNDIEALRMPCPTASEFTILAAGVPWFLTLFGRDSIIASMLSESSLPGVIDDVLRALAATQSGGRDPRTVAEPGKIVHELRVSELATLDEVPYARYYGSVDSTPLFLIALATCRDTDLIASLEPAARAAVGWMLDSGGISHHGFLRYRPDPAGLLHQGWKDSFDAIAHADGRIAEGEIALCEVQGYAWRALRNTAELARTVWSDPDWATELEGVAATLQERFRNEFWMPDADFPALAIDGDGARVEVVASNAGHLLFSGILSARDAERVANRLLEDDMFTGWGIRTLSSEATLYHPLSYHNGSVWPHDTMLAALGMESYGLTDSARRVGQAVADAAKYFDWRLPELFGGFSRDDFPEPVGYAHAARPQAWAAAAGLAASRLSGHPDR